MSLSTSSHGHHNGYYKNKKNYSKIFINILLTFLIFFGGGKFNGTNALLSPSNLVIDENNELLGDPTPLSLIEAIQIINNNNEDFHHFSTNQTSSKQHSRMITITNGGVYRGGKLSNFIVFNTK